MFSYPFHAGDYLKDTAHLTDDEDLAYRRMIDLYYDREGPLPDDVNLIARRVRFPVNTVTAILGEFFEKREDGWHQPRCDREIETYHARQAGAKKAAGVRWQNAGALRPDSERNANREPITENQKPKAKLSSRKKAAPAPESGPLAGDQGVEATLPLPDKEAARKAANAAVWQAYADAYRRRYGIPPVRNVTVNSQIAGLVKRVGAEDAVLLALDYLKQDAKMYEFHPLGLLLRDCEKLVTAMKIGARDVGQAKTYRQELADKAAALIGGAS